MIKYNRHFFEITRRKMLGTSIRILGRTSVSRRPFSHFRAWRTPIFGACTSSPVRSETSTGLSGNVPTCSGRGPSRLFASASVTQAQQDEFPRWRFPLQHLSNDAEVDTRVYIVQRETLFPSMVSSEGNQESTAAEEEEEAEEASGDVDTSSLPWPYSKLGSSAASLKNASGGMAVIGTDGTQQQHIVYSMGASEKVSADSFHKAGYSLRKELQNRKAKNVEFLFDLTEGPSESRDSSSELQSNTDILLHSFQGANYSFSRHVTRKSKRPKAVEGIRFRTGPSGPEEPNKQYAQSCDGFFEDNSRRGITDGMYLARDLSNEREEEVNCQSFEDYVNELVKMHGDKFTMEVIKGSKLRDQDLNMIYAVGQGGRYEPRLIELKYIGDKSRPDEVDVAIVGKGIVFDSGGLNLKPTGNIENMHMDMGGASAAIGAAHAIALQHLQRNIVFSFPLAENCIDSIAYKPHAILKSAKGLTVEVGNTDAEGRLVMADAFTHVQRTHSPGQLIDIATLTGACVIALGEEAGGIFGNNDDLCQQLISSGSYVREPLWQLPLLQGHRDAIRSGSTHADLMSTGTARAGGASTAAAFLEQFVEKGVSWAHLDIAGAGMLSKEKGHLPKGGSGYGSALLTHYLGELK